MFKKLLSNLPFNPSLITHVAFYTQRVRQESMIRRLGFLFLGLTMVIQVLAVMSPAQPTLASSNNDLVYGGFSNSEQATLYCLNSHLDYGTILAHYGISCTDVNNTSQVTLRSTDYSRQLFSMGRLPYGIAGEAPVNIPNTNGGRPLYLRYLWGWDRGSTSTYQALSGTSTGTGAHFFLLFDCGNVVFIGTPQVPAPPAPPAPAPTPAPAPQKPPILTISKGTPPGDMPASGTSVQPGAQLGYRLTFSNSGGTATGLTLTDAVPAHTHVILVGNEAWFEIKPSVNDNPLVWKHTSGLSASTHYVDYIVQVDANTPNNTQICNTVQLKSDQTPTITSNKVCHTVVVNAPPTPSYTPPPSTPCAAYVSTHDMESCLTPHKSVRDVTQNLANPTSANGGDTLEYKLTLTNNGTVKVPKSAYKNIRDNISDILDYADVVDLHGGTLTESKDVTWPSVDVNPDQTITRLITVRVKNPIPKTPVSASDPGHFDCMMTNVFGDTVNVKLGPTDVCRAETVTQTLPNTGPGASLMIGFSLTVIVAYFFARSRLFVAELEIVKDDFVSSGGV